LQRERESNNTRDLNLIVISNSSVIITLAIICCLDLLEKLFRKIVVPEAVWKEVTVENKPGSEKILRAGFIHVMRVHNKRLSMLLEEFVDKGEAETITLALELGADILLVDDHDARNLAKKLGLQVMGTLGVLALAKYRGLVQEVKLMIDELAHALVSKQVFENPNNARDFVTAILRGGDDELGATGNGKR